MNSDVAGLFCEKRRANFIASDLHLKAHELRGDMTTSNATDEVFDERRGFGFAQTAFDDRASFCWRYFSSRSQCLSFCASSNGIRQNACSMMCLSGHGRMFKMDSFSPASPTYGGWCSR